MLIFVNTFYESLTVMCFYMISFSSAIGVTRADDGVYRCSLLTEETVIDSKELKVTVVSKFNIFMIFVCVCKDS